MTTILPWVILKDGKLVYLPNTEKEDETKPETDNFDLAIFHEDSPLMRTFKSFLT